MIDYIIIGVIIICLFFSIKHIMKSKKQGNCPGCGGCGNDKDCKK